LVTPLYLAVIVTGVLLDTREVVIVKVALLLPAATVTLAGTLAADVLLLLNVTSTVLPVGTLPVNLTVPVEVEYAPPLTLVGFRVSVLNAGGITVSVAVLVTVTTP
jgi:hypothetical protein